MVKKALWVLCANINTSDFSPFEVFYAQKGAIERTLIAYFCQDNYCVNFFFIVVHWVFLGK